MGKFQHHGGICSASRQFVYQNPRLMFSTSILLTGLDTKESKIHNKINHEYWEGSNMCGKDYKMSDRCTPVSLSSELEEVRRLVIRKSARSARVKFASSLSLYPKQQAYVSELLTYTHICHYTRPRSGALRMETL